MHKNPIGERDLGQCKATPFLGSIALLYRYFPLLKNHMLMLEVFSVLIAWECYYWGNATISPKRKTNLVQLCMRRMICLNLLCG